MEAKLASIYLPGTEPDCWAHAEKRVPIIDVATTFSYTCDFRQGKAPPDIDYVRIDADGSAVAYRHVTKTKTIEEVVDSVEVRRFIVIYLP